MQIIREARKARKMTQDQLAKAIGVTQGTVAQWEKGITHPSFDKLQKVAWILGLTVDEITKQ